MTTRLLTNSSMLQYKKCPRAYKYRYEMNLVPDEDAAALRIGKQFHKGREVYVKTGDATRAVDAAIDYEGDAHEAAMLAALLAAHIWYWEQPRELADLNFEWIGAEREFAVPLTNPATGRASLTYLLAGKVDADPLNAATREPVIYELKTTGESIDSGSDYWPRLRMDGQISLYVLERQLAGSPVNKILYDVVRKPAMKPLRATPEEARKYKADGSLYANQRERDETPQEWADRLYADIMERPEFYFQRREIVRLSADLAEYQREVWMVGKAINWARLNDFWPRTVTPFTCPFCPYRGPCLENHEPQPGQGFRQVDNPHLELTLAEPVAGALEATCASIEPELNGEQQ